MITGKVRAAVWMLVLGTGIVGPGTARAQEAKPPSPPNIQLAILLDTSNSMDGLINQARTQLWSIVNEMAMARMEGVRPRLTVALYEYGKSTIPAAEGHLRQVLPLTDDLDEVSKQLFMLTTNGGEEYCGKAIQAATRGLSWSDSRRDLRIIVIAGNEPFTQGDTDYKAAVKGAVERGLVINTIYCGPEDEGIRTSWQDGAKRGEGTYSFIDQSAAGIHIDAPQDKKLAELSAQLNTTYLAYGAQGVQYKSRQAEQDRLAAGGGGGVASQRAAAKASAVYTNAGWDLVDAVKEKKVNLEDVKDADLPESMRGKTIEQKREVLQKAAEERARIQEKILKLQGERATFVAAEMAKRGEDKSLGTAMNKSLRRQAESRGYGFEKR